MQSSWLKQANNSAVIVIFSGWGFSAEVFEHLLDAGDEYDVLFVNDYRSLDEPLPDLQHYAQRYLIAWSFGVASFSAWQASRNAESQNQSIGSQYCQFDRMIAINGTMQAVDRFQGIPEVVMRKTIKTLSEQSFSVFAKRCFVSEALPHDLTIDVLARSQELQSVLNRQHSAISGWDQVWVSTQDKIFPTKNLLNAWQAYNDSQSKPALIKHCDAPHAPFHLWSCWADIIFD